MRTRGGVAILTLLAAFASPMFAHDGRPVAPHDLWTRWATDPFTALPLGIAGVLFVVGTRTLAKRAAVHGRRTRHRRAIAFAAGWVALAIALLSPMHAMAESLYAAHMIQHEILMVVAAPLLVMSRPVIGALWALPSSWRRSIGHALDRRPLPRLWGAITCIPVAWALHGAAIWIWHLPMLYERTLASSTAHAAQHLSFLSTALLFWWSIARRRTARVGGVLSLFTTAVHTAALGALIALSPTPWYPLYGETSGAWGLTALEDQQLAGLIMWMPATIAYVAAALWLAAGWLREPGAPVALVKASLGAVGLVMVLTGCQQRPARSDGSMIGADARRGRLAVRRYGCTSCHTVPGMAGDKPSVGPALSGFAGRAYIAGVLPNTPENVMRWITDPPAVDSLTAMPKLGVTANDARDITEFLYTLR